MIKLPMNVINFSGGNTKPYEQMKDYFFHYMSEVANKDLGSYEKGVSLSTKEDNMNTVLLSEINRVSGQTMPEGISLEAWSKNPMIVWASFQTVGMMIDAVLPETIIRSIGVYTDLKIVDYGETATYDIMPNALFTVSKSSNAQRTAFRQKQFKTSVTLTPENHAMTVMVSLYKVLSKKESLAEFVRKSVISMETEMTKDAYGALSALVNNASFPKELQKTGYTQDSLLNLCEVETAYSQGQKATIVGTATAVSKILGSAANGYRIVTPSENMGIQLIKNFFDYDILVLPQVATGVNYGLALDDTKLYIISTSTDKIIKGALEGNSLTNSNDFYDNADLTSNATINKRWKFEAIGNSKMGVMKLQ